ncbi:eukaryotic translation initiation factor 5B, partial [Spiromyces aspiralis]
PSVETFLKAAPVVQRCARMRAPRQIDCESWSRRRLASILEQAVTSSGSSTDVQVASAAWLLGYWLMAGCSTEFTLSSSKSGYNVARIEKYAQNVDPAATVHVDDAIHILDAAGKSLLAPLIRAAGFLDHSSKRKTMPEWFVREDLDLIRRVFLGGCSAASSSGSSPYASEFGNAARVIHIADAELALKLQYLARCSGFRVACTNSGCGFEIDLSRAEATSADGRHYTWDFRVEALGADRYYGFCVDGNHRFLLGDLTETHNTKLLDKIRQTNVQDQEAGGITQQIGATFFPRDTLDKKIAPVNTTGKVKIRIPGLLTLDTPGHSHFGAIRARGSKLCNIAVLVVDIMHGLEPQTIESIRLLRDRKTPFVVALNKIDRIFGWKSIPDGAFRQSLKMQKKGTISEFEMRVQNTITEFAEQGLNARLYYENKNFAKYVSLVPTSAITGEGIPDLLALLITLTQTRMSSELLFLSKLECAVLEVKVIEGLGTTIDVVLSNGILKEGDRIVVCGLDGPIVTNVRALLTPQPMREMRVKSAYVHHKKIKASMGVKIVAPGLEKAIAGSRMLVVGSDDDEEELIEDVMSDLTSLQNVAKKTDRGVWVQASTLGSLEALLGFLEDSNIPVAGINIGPVHKKDVTRASTMLEKAKEYAVMLCFDVKVEKEAQELADELGVKVFKADIIYHLFDAFTDYNAKIREQKRKDQAPQAIFPCVLNIIKGAVFNKRDPIIIGCDVMEGQLRVGTPVCVVRQNPETKQNDVISLGRVASLEINRKPVDIVRKGEAGGGVAVRIDCPLGETPKMYDRHFTDADPIYSQITRTSIDVLKESFRNDVSRDEWQLIIKLKKMLDIK